MYQQERGDLDLVATGDSLITRPLSCYSEEAFRKLVEIIRSAPVAFTNLEMLIHEFEGFPAAESGGTYTVTDPTKADELKWMGFNLFARANNHSMDYGIEGMLATSRVLDERGMVHAGVGRNLAEARSPAYLEVGQGRVALLSATSTFASFGRAGHQRPDMPGRPGLNPLRYRIRYVVDEETLGVLRKASEALGYEALKARRRQWLRREEREDEFDFFGLKFVLGDEFAIRTEPHQGDMQENLKWVKEARRQADWVVFSLHSHESGAQLEHPAEFVETFARACIDAGVDVFIGHGPHFLRGVEIYKGRPIFYSLGNFIFQNETVLRLPADIYERYRLGHDATPADLYDARTDQDRKGFPADPVFWESVVAVCRFRQRQLQEVELWPVALGYGKHRVHRGRPMLAQGDQAEQIIAKLASLSERYGTQITYEDGVGRVVLSG